MMDGQKSLGLFAEHSAQKWDLSVPLKILAKPTKREGSAEMLEAFSKDARK